MPAPRRDPAVGGIANFPRASLAAGILVLALALSGNAGYARDRLPGDVESFAMIGFTVADVDRETVFSTKVLSLEKVADFRVIGSEFNTSMRIVHLKLGEQMVAQAELAAKKALMICDPNGHAIRLIEE